MREFALLDHVFRANEHLGPRVEIPPGDDMAMLGLDGRSVLVAVDQVVDGRHVDCATHPLALVGRKAVTRSLSDIAAMAATPRATLVSVVLPPDFGEDRARALFDAMRLAASEYDCPLIGGDVAFHASGEGKTSRGVSCAPLICSVTVLAEPGPRGAVRRSGAQVGDRVYVTGSLGASLTATSDGMPVSGDRWPHHLTFEPRIVHALALAEQLGDRLHAMIDISDGLGRDAGHIANASDVRIELDASALPCRAGCDWRRAIGDGEDYELCFAAGPSGGRAGTHDVPSEILGVPITCVGKVVERAQHAGADTNAARGECFVRTPDGEMLDAATMGWEHHA